MQFPLMVLVMVGTALAAPPVLVLQPLLISRDVQGPGNQQILLAAAPQGNVVLLASQSESQHEGGEDNGQYVEKYEDYNEGSKNEGKEDYSEKTEDYNEKTEEYNEKPEEYNEKTEEYNEKTEEYNEKTEEYNEKPEEYNEKTENYDEKYEETSEGKEDYNEKYEEEQHETTPSPDYAEKDDDTRMYETKDYEGNAIEGSGESTGEGNSMNRAGKSSDKRETPEGEDNTKQLREEIVLGSQNKAEVTSTPAVVKLAPPLKETEEVQLAPVVYHVSPKELSQAPKK